jgi:hypothetical protein
VVKDDRARTVTVHFKGFKDKWDETLAFGGGRLAPIHSKTAYREQIAPIKAFVGEELDAQDSRGVWLEARVIETDLPFGLVRISYLGWPSRWDEWINTDSYRLVPRNFQSMGVQDARQIDREFCAFLAAHMTVHEIDKDGNCLFRAVAHQLYGDARHHALVRRSCCNYMAAFPDRFAQFVAGDFARYLSTMRQSGTWGDQPELRALSDMYARPIWLYSAQERDPPLLIGDGADFPMLLSYHLQSHYNSLTVAGGWHKLPSAPGEWEAGLEQTYPPPQVIPGDPMSASSSSSS